MSSRSVARSVLVFASLFCVAPAPAAAASADPSRLGQTGPVMTTVSPFAPLMPVVDGVDIATLATGAAVERPLAAQLGLLFESFFASATPGSHQIVQLQVAFSFLPTPGAPPASVPIALVHTSAFAVPGDWSAADQSSFVGQVAAHIQTWMAQQAPSGTDAQLTFDLAGTQNGPAQPLVQVSGLALPLSDIADL